MRLKINGVWVDEPGVLKQHATDFYKTLFDSKDVLPLSDPLARWQPMLTLPEKEALMVPFSHEEARFALLSMQGLKAPRPDSIQPLFLQRAWDVVHVQVLTFMNQALS